MAPIELMVATVTWLLAGDGAFLTTGGHLSGWLMGEAGAHGAAPFSLPMMIAGMGDLGDFLPIAQLVTAVVIFIAFCGVAWRWWTLRDEIAGYERDISAALRKKTNVKISETAKEIEELAQIAIKLGKEKDQLQKQFESSDSTALSVGGSADRQTAALVAICLDAALKSAEALQNDADFQAVDQSLGLQAGLKAAADTLQAFPRDGDPAAHFVAALDKGDLNTALTVFGFIDAYYFDRREWRKLWLTLRAVDAVLAITLSNYGIQIVQIPILTVVSAEQIRHTQVSDRRNVQGLPQVRRQAARVARDLQPEEFLIVDCHAPGWVFEQIRRLPSIAVFNPSSWT